MIDLTNRTNFLAFIVLDDDGEEVTNQVGGCVCDHPIVTGIVVYLPIDYFPHDSEDCFRDSPGNSSIEEWLSDKPKLLRALEEDKSWWQSGDEAWIPLRVKDDCKNKYLRAYAGRRGILTYCNSD